MNEAAATLQEVASPDSGTPWVRPIWPPGVVNLSTLLLFTGDPADRAAISSLYGQCTSPDGPGPPDVPGALRPLLLAGLARTARVFAAAFEVTLEQLLDFACPGARQAELVTPRCVLRRWDRIWNGPPVHTLDALRPLALAWPGPRDGFLLVLRPPVRHHGSELGSDVGAGRPVRIPIGHPLEMEAGALLALKAFPPASLLDAAQAAGMNAAAVADEICGRSRALALGSGQLAFQGSLVRINQRDVRLTDTEAALLQCLAARAGRPVARAELARAAHMRNPRGLDKIMAQLRDKLGDGIIATVYGTGYALELQP